MKIKQLYTVLTAMMLVLGISACSDNSDKDLKPTSTPRELELEADGQTTSDKTGAKAISIALNAGTKPIHVEVKSNTIWKVEVSGNTGWCEVDVVRGQGDGSFTISVLDNVNLHDTRYCSVYVYQIDADGEEYKDSNKATINISQEGSDVRITPSDLDIFPAQDVPNQEFQVIANTSWTLSVSYETEDATRFLTIEPGNGMEAREEGNGKMTYFGDGNASFTVKLQNNGTALVRRATIELKSGSGNYSIEISQQKSEYTFDVSPNGIRYVKPEGDTLDFNVYSTAYGWSVSNDGYSWITCPEGDFQENPNYVPIKVAIAPNTNGRERTGTITFKSKNQGYEDIKVTIVQTGYPLFFSGSITEGSTSLDASGGTILYSLDSGFDWKISAPDWIQVSPASGSKSEDRQTLQFTISPNNSNEVRRDTVRIIPLKTTFSENLDLNPDSLGFNVIKLYISQKMNDYRFEMSPEGFDVVDVNGGNLELTIDSRFDWVLTSSDWVKPTLTKGSASGQPQKVSLSIGKNLNNDTQNGYVELTPQPTRFNGEMVNPVSLGIIPIRKSITQFGGKNPAISEPWLLDDYTQTSATVEFNFYSPFYQIVEAGLEWSKEDGTGAARMTVTPSDATDCTVSFELTGLNAATKYIARGYVIDSEGRTRYGQWSYPFTTAGRYPGAGDNPTPTR